MYVCVLLCRSCVGKGFKWAICQIRMFNYNSSRRADRNITSSSGVLEANSRSGNQTIFPSSTTATITKSTLNKLINQDSLRNKRQTRVL